MFAAAMFERALGLKQSPKFGEAFALLVSPSGYSFWFGSAFYRPDFD